MKYRFVISLLIFTFSLLCASAQGGKVLNRHVEALSDTTLKGRAAGSEGEASAASYFYNYLKENGVEMLTDQQGDVFTIMLGDTLVSRNIIGVVEGCDPVLRNQYIVVAANLDHLGVNFLNVNGEKREQVFRGANDNASGLAVVMELAKEVAATSYMFRRSVIFAAFGSKEEGMAGSWYFLNKSFGHQENISLMVNVLSAGFTGPDNKFSSYIPIPSKQISSMASALRDRGGLFYPTYYTGVPDISSDYLAFYEKNIPSVIFTSGRDLYSRSVNDIPSNLDYESMEYMTDYIYSFVLEAANSEEMAGRPDRRDKDDNDKENNEPADRIYSPFDVDTPPTFFKGDESRFLTDWVYKYLRYPDYSLSQGIQGTVKIEFIIEKDGTLSNVRVLSAPADDLENEAVRVVSASPKWKAGVIAGKKVRVRYTLPIEFRLKKK